MNLSGILYKWDSYGIASGLILGMFVGLVKEQ